MQKELLSKPKTVDNNLVLTEPKVNRSENAGGVGGTAIYE
jgi:hypothetical protein